MTRQHVRNYPNTRARPDGKRRGWTILEHGSRLGASLCASYVGGARADLRNAYVRKACEIGGVVSEPFLRDSKLHVVSAEHFRCEMRRSV